MKEGLFLCKSEQKKKEQGKKLKKQYQYPKCLTMYYFNSRGNGKKIGDSENLKLTFKTAPNNCMTNIPSWGIFRFE